MTEILHIYVGWRLQSVEHADHLVGLSGIGVKFQHVLFEVRAAAELVRTVRTGVLLDLEMDLLLVAVARAELGEGHDAEPTGDAEDELKVGIETLKNKN